MWGSWGLINSLVHPRLVTKLTQKLKVLVAQSHGTHCNPTDCSPPGSSVHGILQARIPEWVAIPFSKGSSQPRDQSWASHIAGKFFTVGATKEAKLTQIHLFKLLTLDSSYPVPPLVHSKDSWTQWFKLWVTQLVLQNCSVWENPHISDVGSVKSIVLLRDWRTDTQEKEDWVFFLYTGKIDFPKHSSWKGYLFFFLIHFTNVYDAYYLKISICRVN